MINTFSPDYNVPSDIKSLGKHLDGIWLYYRYIYPTMDFIPMDVYARFEFVMHKVILQASLSLHVAGIKILEDAERIRKSAKSMNEKKKKLAELIINEFNGLKDSTKKSGIKRRIVRSIFNKLNNKVKDGKIDPKEFGKKGKKQLTSEDTIKRYLEEKNSI